MRLHSRPAARVHAPEPLAADLRARVERYAIPRHPVAEPEANERVAHLLADDLRAAGLDVGFDGPFRNVVALPRDRSRPLVLVGAHYDSVPGCPGADDNASALAVLTWLAQELGPEHPIAYVAFNWEEDGLRGSRDLVDAGLARLGVTVSHAHVLEMLGFTADRQEVPDGLPIAAPADGRFLARVTNGRVPLREGPIPLLQLDVWFGLERWFPVLHRSDHAPFWAAGVPATLWTDTAEFRNPHYHRQSDTPDTLDYTFLAGAALTLRGALADQPARR
jgi:Peptidase family M28